MSYGGMSDAELMAQVTLEIDVRESMVKLRQFSTLMGQSLGLLRRFAGTDDARKAIAMAQKLIMILNQARMAIAAFQLAATPLGFGLAGVAVGTLMVSAVSFTEDVLDADRGN